MRHSLHFSYVHKMLLLTADPFIRSLLAELATNLICIGSPSPLHAQHEYLSPKFSMLPY